MLPIIEGARFRPGDLLGLAAPASSTREPARIDEVIAHLEKKGFTVRAGKHLRERTGYFAGNDAQRAADLQQLFADREVRAIFALRGGYGSGRLLPLLDFAAIRTTPKLLIGYSDITALQLALFSQAGLTSCHGPNANQAFLPENEFFFARVALDPAPGMLILLSPTLTPALVTVRPGRAIGRLLGGNLTTLSRLIGTPFAPDFQGAILFLEDVSEKAYRLDGLFTQLRQAGILDQIGGLILGRFDHPQPEEQVLIARFIEMTAAQSLVPTLRNAPIGHHLAQVSLPVGALVELDATARTLRVTG